jgi:hypothetical protein
MAQACKEHRKFAQQLTGSQHIMRDRHMILEKLEGRRPYAPNLTGPHVMDSILIKHPYPPCVRDLADLEPVLFSELAYNSHHRGRVLLAKLIGILAITRTDTFAAIEDVSGDIEYLRVPFVCMNRKLGHDWPQLGSWLAIKEPFLTLEKLAYQCIQLDHPSHMKYAESWPLGLFEKFGLTTVLTDRISQPTHVQGGRQPCFDWQRFPCSSRQLH